MLDISALGTLGCAELLVRDFLAMPDLSTPIESAYRDAIDAMSPAERVARSAAMFQWTRQQLARQIIAERTVDDGSRDIDPETLKWMVALRLYGDQPVVRRLIEQTLRDVSG